MALVSLGAVVALASCASSGTGETSGNGDDGGMQAPTEAGANDSPSGTCDANFMSDPMHCGQCTTACSNGQVCNGGTCQTACGAPLFNCPNETQCIDLTSDKQNCGACGTSCIDPQGATAQCVQSQCVYTCTADAGVTSCSGDTGGPAGCYDLTSSSQHCGMCSTQCTAMQTCVDGVCCAQNDQLCGGACTDVTKDPNNCGSCNASCPSTGQCISGKCLGYTVASPTGTFVDACKQTSPTSLTSVLTGGDWAMSGVLTLPFPFTFYGAPQTQAWVGNEGTVGFGPPMGYIEYPDCNDPNPFTTYAALVPYGDDNLQVGTGAVCYATTGTAPSRQFVVTWEQVTNANDTGSALSFSVILTETANTIDFAYSAITSPDGDPEHAVAGANTTVGMQSPSGGMELFVKQFCGQGSVGFLSATTPTTFRFTPVP